MRSLARIIDALVSMHPEEAAAGQQALDDLVCEAAPGEFAAADLSRARDLAVAAADYWQQLAALEALETAGYSPSGAPSPVALPTGGICG